MIPAAFVIKGFHCQNCCCCCDSSCVCLPASDLHGDVCFAVAEAFETVHKDSRGKPPSPLLPIVALRWRHLIHTQKKTFYLSRKTTTDLTAFFFFFFSYPSLADKNISIHCALRSSESAVPASIPWTMVDCMQVASTLLLPACRRLTLSKDPNIIGLMVPVSAPPLPPPCTFPSPF